MNNAPTNQNDVLIEVIKIAEEITSKLAVINNDTSIKNFNEVLNGIWKEIEPKILK